jgi:hypothetical protein
LRTSNGGSSTGGYEALPLVICDLEQREQQVGPTTYGKFRV